MPSPTTALFALLPLASAHFQMKYPTSRGFSEDTIVNYPCGGFDTPLTTRTPFPLSGGPIQLNMEHTQVNCEVLIAMSNAPTGGDYHTVLVPTFYEQGPDSFCIDALAAGFPSSLGAKAGMNATIMVQTNGDPSGGLYACADITFTSTPLSASEFSSHCTNSTGIKVTPLNTKANANETTAGSGSSTGSAAPAKSSGSSAARQTAYMGAGVGALAALAGFAVL